MVIDIISVEIKNFLCFGNAWQKFELKEGFNLIIGKKEGNSSSNGVGKSNTLSSILFGLYGKVEKDINKDQIPNWKNKKNCEVKIHFKKDKDIFTIHRGISPNFLKLYKNGQEEDQLSHNRNFQEYIEKNILGIDYDTFLSIAHYNATQSQSIFNVSKGAKRAFLEKIFGLEIYTDLATKCNLKSTATTSKLNNIQQQIEFNNNSIIEIESQTKNFQSEINDLNSKNYDKKIKIVKEKIETALELEKKIIEDVKKLQEKQNKIKDKLSELDSKKQELEKEKYALVQTSNTIQECYASFDEFELNKLQERKEKLEKISKVEDSEIKELKNNFELIQTGFEVSCNGLATLKGMRKAIPDYSDDSVTECPMCGNQVKAGFINEHLEEKRNNLTKIISDQEKQNKQIEQDLKEVKTKYNNIVNAKKSYDNAQLELQNIELKIQQELQAKFEAEKNKENNKRKYDLLKQAGEILKQIEEIINEISKYNKMNNLVEKQIEDVQSSGANIDVLNNQLNELLIEQQSVNNQIEKFNKFIEENNNKIVVINDKEKELKIQEKKLKTMLDYLEFIKKICKDEGVRNYAIQNTVPFITQRINKYLADAGVSFYVKLDSQFNIEIRGTGIVNGTFGSLSSGQQKVTNIATLLAFQDLYKLRSPLYPNLCLLDEILDSSVDSHTLTQIMTIIQEKQKSEHLKCYIVSHRKEISEVSAFDSIIQVFNANGFAKLQEVAV